MSKKVPRYIAELRKLRIRSGLTQTDVANLLNTTNASISRFEKQGGIIFSPTIKTLERYAKAVNAQLKIQVKANE